MLQTLFRIAFTAAFAWFVHEYIKFMRLRYDENDATCEYYKAIYTADTWRPTLVFLLTGVIFLPSMIVCGNDWSLTLLQVGALCVMLPAWYRMDYRYNKWMHVLSARHVERKYGANFQHMMAIMDAGCISAFPITQLEDQWGLSVEQKAEPVIDDKVMRAQCVSEVDRMHELLLRKKLCENSLHLYFLHGRILHDTKLEKLMNQLMAESVQTLE